MPANWNFRQSAKIPCPRKKSVLQYSCVHTLVIQIGGGASFRVTRVTRVMCAKCKVCPQKTNDLIVNCNHINVLKIETGTTEFLTNMFKHNNFLSLKFKKPKERNKKDNQIIDLRCFNDD